MTATLVNLPPPHIIRSATDAGQTPVVFLAPFRCYSARCEGHASRISDRILRRRAAPTGARSARRTVPSSPCLPPGSRAVFAAAAETTRLLPAGKNRCLSRWSTLTGLSPRCAPHSPAFHYNTSSQLEMWASAQRDGRPAEYRWRPLFDAAKFG